MRTKPTIEALSSVTIKRWAYKKSKESPPANLFNLQNIVEYSDLIFRFAADKNCPQRNSILHHLYYIVGESVSKHSEEDIKMIQVLINKVSSSHGSVIENWVTRTKMILKDLKKYDYVEWCSGGFVMRDLQMSL